MDVVFEELREELCEEREVICDFDDEITGGQETDLCFLDDNVNDSSLGL